MPPKWSNTFWFPQEEWICWGLLLEAIHSGMRSWPAVPCEQQTLAVTTLSDTGMHNMHYTYSCDKHEVLRWSWCDVQKLFLWEVGILSICVHDLANRQVQFVHARYMVVSTVRIESLLNKPFKRIRTICNFATRWFHTLAQFGGVFYAHWGPATFSNINNYW